MEATPRDRERERERDWDRDWDRVVGPLPPPLPLLPSVELMESMEKDLPLRRSPPLVVCVRPREVDLDLLEEVFSLSLCLFFLVEVGLEAFLLYRLGAVVSGRWSEGKGEAGRVWLGDRDPETVLMEASPPSPEGGEELVTGANTMSLLTCTSHLPVLLYLAASVSKLI